MKAILKKIFSLTLAIVMVVGLTPAFELKAEAETAYAVSYDSQSNGNFEDFWKTCYEYSRKNGDCGSFLYLFI